MSVRPHRRQFARRDRMAARLAAFAEATEMYAETLDDPDLANV